MIKSLLKFLVFVAVILLLGQVEYEGTTIGAQFHEKASKFWLSARDTAEKSQMLAQIGDTKLVKSIIGNKTITISDSPEDTPEDSAKEKTTKPKHTEHISEEDRRTLMRLLQ